MPSVDLSNTVDEIQGQIEALKTYTEVSKSYNALLKKTANSSSKSTPQLSTQLDKFKHKRN